MKRYISRTMQILAIAGLVTFLSTCSNLFNPGLGEKVDINPPTVSIDSHSDGQYVQGTVTFGGSFGDDRDEPVLEVSIDGGSTFSSVGSVDQSSGVWSHDIDTTNLADREYEIRLRVTDQADKVATAKVIVNVDNTAPVVLFRTPQGTASSTFNQTIPVSGDAYDSFGITEVRVTLLDGDGNTLYMRKDSEALDAARNSEQVKHDIADGTNSWSYPFDSTLYTGDVAEYGLVVSALDKAGNESSGFFYVDTLRTQLDSIPTVNQLYAGTKGVGSLASIDLTALLSPSLRVTVDQQQDLPKFEFQLPSAESPDLGEDPVATGAITDDDGIAPESVEILLDRDPDATDTTDDHWLAVTAVNGSGGRVNWEHDLASLQQGPHTLAVRATDIDGRTAVSQVISFAIDYGPPTLILESPTAGGYHRDDIVVSGRVQDGAGMTGVEVSADGGTSYTQATLTQVSAPGQGGQTGEWTWTYDYDLQASPVEGVISFRVRAVDVAGKTANDSVQVTVDYTAPVLEFLSPAEGSQVNGAVLIQGTTEDRSPITNLALYAEEATEIAGTTTPIARIDETGTNSFSAPASPDSSVYRWYHGVATTIYQQIGEAARNQAFTIVALDAAGNESAVQVEVTIDQATDLPVITMDTPSLIGTAEVFTSNSSLVGTLSDDDGLDLSTAEYALYTKNGGGSWPDPPPDSQPLFSNPDSTTPLARQWSVSLPDAGGEYRLTIDVVDEAGTPAEQFFLELILDEGPPTITETASGIPSSATVYRNTDVPLGGTVTDGFGVESVVVEYSRDGGSAVELFRDETGAGAWNTTLESSLGDGAYEITVTAVDDVGVSSQLDRTIVIDTASPTLSVTNPVDAEFIDGTSYTIRGQVTDEGGKGVSTLEYSTDGGSTWTPIPLTGLNWSVGGVDFSVGGEGNKTLEVRASDGLNAASTVTVDFYYDESPPSLSEDGIGTDAQVVRSGDFTLSGVASDTNALSDVRITATKDGISQGEVYSTTSAGAYSYSRTLPGDGSEDGVWEYRLTASDVAGRTTEVVRTVLIDETAPVVPVIDAFAGAYQVNELVSSGTASDGGGSGVQIVEYSFDQTNWGTATGTGSWFRTIDISVATGAGLTEGDHTLYVRAIDRAGNESASGTRVFTVDRADPVVTVDASYDGTVYRSSDFTMEGTITDSLGLPVSPVGVTVIDPTATPVDLSGNPLSYDGGASPPTWSQTVPVGADGSYTVTITGTDAVGRTSQAERTVVVDTAAPSLGGINLSDGALISAGSFTVSGTASDGSGSGVSVMEYRLNGGSWTAATGTSSWNVALSGLSDGLGQTLELRTTDNAGNTSAVESRGFDVDLSPPQVAETTSGIGGSTTVYRNADVSLGGTATDGNGVTSVVVEYSKDGAGTVELFNAPPDGADAWTTSLSAGLGDGAYEVTITATDAVGKTTTLTRNIAFDSAAPVLTVTNPVDAEFIDGASYTIRGQVTDEGGKGVSTLEYSTDGGSTWTPIPLTGLNWSVGGVDFSVGGEGNKTLEVRASDGLNAASTVTVDFYYDESPPSLSEDGIGTDAQVVRSGDFTLSGVASDTNALSDVRITATKDGISQGEVYSTTSAGAYSYSRTLPGDGSEDGVWEYRLTASDVAGRTTEVVRTVLIDETAPVVPVIDAFAGAYQVNELVSSGTASDGGGSGVQIVEYSFDQTNWGTATGTGSWFRTIDISVATGAGLTEGDHTLYVRAIDRAGNESASGTRVFTVDRADPVVTVDASYDGTVYRSSDFTMEGTITDSLGLPVSPVGVTVIDPTATPVDLSGNPLSYDGGASPPTWSQTVPVGADGSYTVTITGTDAVGRTSQAERTVVVDTAAPSLGGINLSDGALISAGSFTVSGTASDGSGSGVSVMEYRLNGGSWTAATGTSSWNVALSGLSDGLGQTLELRTTDNAGNTSAVESRGFDVDLSPPQVAETTSGIGGSTTVYRNADVSLGGTATDGNGVTSVVVEYSKDGAGTVELFNAPPDGADAWTTSLSAGLGDGAYEVTITATDAVGKTTTLTRNIVVDTVLPTGEYTSVSPVVGANTVNGKIDVRAAVADDVALDTLEWALLPELPGGDTPTAGDYTTVSGSRTSPLFEIDTTVSTDNVLVNGGGPYSVALSDEAVSQLWIRAVDRAGNEFEVAQDLAVSQASDDPAISFTTIDDTATTPGESFTNLIESNGLLRFTITDDDLVDASSIEISIGDNTSWQSINYNGASVPADALSVTTGHDLYNPTMLGEGTISFYLRVADEASAKEGLVARQAEVGPIYLMIDRNFPELTETNLGGDVFRSALFGLSGSVSDTNDLKNLTILESVNAAPATTVLDADLSGTSDTWSLVDMPSTGTAADGVYAYTVTLTDASDKQTVVTRAVTIDTTAPALPVVTTPSAGAWLNSSTFIFTGTASDGTGSGVNSVFFTETSRGAGPPAKGDAAWRSASVDGSGNWNVSVEIAAAGTRDFHAYSVDAAGNEGPVRTHAFGLDQASPSATVTGGVSATAYVNSDFTIDGTFTDASGLSSLTVETSTDNTSFSPADPASASFDNGPGTWSWSRTLGGQVDGTFYYRFTFTDVAGNSSQITKTVNLDRQAPTVTFDATSPSIGFNAGAQTATANGTMSLTGSVVENQGTGNLQILEYRLDGGSYTSLVLDGTFTISSVDTTGYADPYSLPVDLRAVDRNGNVTVETFTLNIDQSTDMPIVTISAPTEGESIQQVNVSVSGTIEDDDGVSGDPGTVQYRYSPDDGTTWGPWTDFTVTGAQTSRSFTFSIGTTSDGAKDLEIRAVDVDGTVSNTVGVGFILDTEEPELTGVSPGDDTYFNADFAVTGTVSDDNGFVDHLRYRVERDGVQTTAWTSIIGPGNATNSEPFNQSIDTSSGTGTYEIFLEATDDAGFTRERSITVLVDKTDPTAAFNTPAAASTQNNIISIAGSAGDNAIGDVSSIEFRVVDPGATEHPLPTGSVSGLTNWIIADFDTRDAMLMSYAEDLGGGVREVTLRAIVTDLAGNAWTSAGGNDLVFQVDQATDRPTVTFDTLATDGSSTLTTTTIRGTVTDDDGVSDIFVDTWNAGNSGATPDHSESVVLTSGSWGDADVDWRIVLSSNGNGLRGIRVRAVDTVDNNGSDYSGTDYSRSDTGRIDFNLDTELPDVAVTSPNPNITWSSNNTFIVTGTSGDETGIIDLEYKIDDNDFAAGTTSIAAPYDTWSLTVPQGDLADGPHTIYVQATDSVGNTRIASRQLSVDKTAPTIGITSPPTGSDVYGPVTIGGTAADNPGGAGVESISVGLGKQIDEGDLAGSTWTAVPGTTSWSFDFANINDYANNTYSTNTGDADGDGIEDAGETWTDLWDFTFYVRAIDDAGDGAGGNIAYLTSYTLTIDPKQDRPEVNVLSPEDGATVGGFVRVFGSAFDGQFVEKVQIAIDANNNGDYTDDTWSEGALDETDPDGTNWYLANGTTSWNVNLNENSEFDPTGGDTTRTVRFKVRAWDYKTAPGDGIPGAAVENSVTFNKSFPRFDGMSLTSGATVGGIVELIGIVRDESDLDRIIFSNEGPLLDNTVIFDNPGGLLPPGTNTTVVQTTPNPYGGADIEVELLGTSDPDHDSAFPGSYRIRIPIDTEAPGLYFDGAGSMSVKVTAEDVTSPSPFTNQNLISFNVDNVDPSLLTFTGDSEILGTAAELKGTVRDTGTVSGIDRLTVYLTNAAGELVRIKGGSGTIAVFTEADVLDQTNATYDDYRMVIDNQLEDGNDDGSAGDGDGIDEFLSIAAGTYNWSGLFDSTLVSDGAVTVHFTADDFAGNRTSNSVAAFVANNKPSIDSVVLGTDLDDSGTVEADERTAPITGGFGATGYTARNDYLYIEINASGGNGTLRYSVFHEGGEQNGSLTSNILVIDTSGFPDSSLDNDKDFAIEVYDSTTSDDADKTNELIDTVMVSLTIDNVDEIPPSISIAPLGETYNESADDGAKSLQAVTDYQDNIVMSGDTRLGHVEYAGNSLFDNGVADGDAIDDDADLSGQVIFRGKAEDNQRISRITAAISGYDPDGGGAAGQGDAFDIYDVASGGAQTAADWVFAIDGSNYLTDSNGNVFNWAFEWNTASLASVVGKDVTITVTVYDSNGTPNQATAGLQFDVAPYVTGIATPDRIAGGLKDQNIRSAGGAYSVKAGGTADFITVNGFNLSPIADGVRISNSAFPDGLDAGTPVGEILASSAPTAGFTELTVSNGATRSGYLAILTGGAGDPIPLLNNINDNTQSYNQEPDPFITKNELLDDDRYIRFFQVNTTAYGSEGVTYPTMYMNGDTPEFAYADNNAASGSGGYETLKRNGTRVARGWQYSQNGVARDVDGNFYQVSITDNSGSNAGGLHMFFNQYATGGVFSDGWAYPEYAGYGGINSYNNNNNAIFLDHLKYDGDPNGNDGFLKLNRYVSPKLVVTGGAATTAQVFLSYYDTRLGELAFRNFTIGQDAGAGGLALAGGYNTNQPSGQPANNTNSTASGRHTVTTQAGEYFDMGVTSGGVVVIVYYDQLESRLELVYSTEADNTTPRSLDGSAPTDTVYWSTPRVLGDLYQGTHASMTVHSDDSLHVAAYDSSVAGLTYFYLTGFSDTTPEAVAVDTNNSVGIWTDIVVSDTGTPHIAYYNNSENGTRESIKIASANHDVSAGLLPGVDTDGYVTGSWDFATVPVDTVPQGGIPQFNRLGIALRPSDGEPLIGYLGDGIEYTVRLAE